MNLNDFFFVVLFFVVLVFAHESSAVDADEYRYHPISGRNHEAKREVRDSYGHSSEEDTSHGSHFGYRNTDDWGRDYPDCRGTRQSPIDLNSYDMAKLAVEKPLKWQGYGRIPRNMTLSNNGHTVELTASWKNDAIPYLSGGPLAGDYAFAQLHFHWGPRNDVGSEHTINNRSLPLEMHMVHYKKEYGSASEAMKRDDGLAVIGILFEVNPFSNRGISRMQSFMGSVRIPETKVAIPPFSLVQFNLKFPNEYVAYLGSLTTPPCSEIVTWIIPAIPLSLHRKELASFRSIELNNGDDHNFRPTQPRNNRIVYYISR